MRNRGKTTWLASGITRRDSSAPAAPHDVLVVHRLANAMLAQLLLLTSSGDGDAATLTPRVFERG